MTNENEVPMPEKPINLSNEQAVELVGRFLPKEWKFLKSEDVSITRMQ